MATTAPATVSELFTRATALFEPNSPAKECLVDYGIDFMKAIEGTSEFDPFDVRQVLTEVLHVTLPPSVHPLAGDWGFAHTLIQNGPNTVVVLNYLFYNVANVDEEALDVGKASMEVSVTITSQVVELVVAAGTAVGETRQELLRTADFGIIASFLEEMGFDEF